MGRHSRPEDQRTTAVPAPADTAADAQSGASAEPGTEPVAVDRGAGFRPDRPVSTRPAATQSGRPQSGPTQSGRPQSGPTQSGPTQSGPTQSGPTQSGPTQSGPTQGKTATFDRAPYRASEPVSAPTAARGPASLSDQTQVIPRVPAATVVSSAPRPVPSADTPYPSADTAYRSADTAYPSTTGRHPGGTTTVGADPDDTTVFDRSDLDGALTAHGPEVGTPDVTADPDVEAVSAKPRHHRLVWVGLAVFWLLGLGAGLVSLTSLGARASCTGNDKSLDCGDTGSALGIALTLGVIVLVGVVSVHAWEVRDRARLWARDLALGILILLVLSFAAWRLILTING